MGVLQRWLDGQSASLPHSMGVVGVQTPPEQVSVERQSEALRQLAARTCGTQAPETHRSPSAQSRLNEHTPETVRAPSQARPKARRKSEEARSRNGVPRWSDATATDSDQDPHYRIG